MAKRVPVNPVRRFMLPRQQPNPCLVDARPRSAPAVLRQNVSVQDREGPQRLSVIIPARNEAEQIGRVLHHVLRAKVAEMIVVDGHSSDGTRGIARSYGAKVVASQPGRGVQMNAGAAAARGNVFVFLHADTCVPEGFDAEVVRLLAKPGVSAGAFRLRIDAPNRSLRLIEKLVNWRSRLLQIPYGDQAIFLKRRTFYDVGGFAELPMMEDFDLVRRLRRLGRIEIAPLSVVTSARRWLNCGIWRTTMLNQVWLAAYFLGVPARHIAVWRQCCVPMKPDDHSLPEGAALDESGSDRSETPREALFLQK